MKKILLIALTLGLAATANASEEKKHEDITLVQVKEKATIKTQPDMFKAVIEFSTTDYSAKDAQLDLNKQIKKATDTVTNLGLKYELASFRTHQEYKSKKFKASQSIKIETKNKVKLEEIATELQNQNGKVINTSSFVSKEAKQTFFETLFSQAYDKAIEKANFITSKVKGEKFGVTRIDYYLNEQSPRPYMARAMSAEMATSAAPKMQIDSSDKELWLDLTLSIEIEQDKK
ncbi:MAG TPA: hypothetical protein DCL21_04860 [Alphaproteobacteria bacterium]|nr:hypothetical protein [Alphaproteobacteria bacterium]